MLSNCCPASSTLPTIPAETCAQNFGQRQKFIFQRLKDSRGDRVSIDDTDAVKISTWVALKGSGDDTQIAVTPFIENPADDGGDARTYGGGNETLNGIEMVIGSNPTNVTCRLNGKKQDIIAALKLLECEALSNNLGVYSINEKGQIEGIKEGHKWFPAPIQKFFVSDKKHGDFDGPDYNDMSFSYAPGYSDNLDVITLDQSALQL